MLERVELFPLNYYKKSHFSGNIGNMKFRLEKSGDDFLLTIYPGPKCFERTSSDIKEESRYPFTEEGIAEVLSFINRQFEERREEWESHPHI